MAHSIGTKIGILDSGVGGLSVLLELRHILPDNPISYVGDSAWCPYGNKSSELIQHRVRAITEFLLEQGCEIIVVACNSATIHAVEYLRATYPIPFVGMEPAVKPAVALTRTGVIGILATEASLAGDKFHTLLHTHGQGVRLITTPCPDFVETVEQGKLSGPSVEQSISKITRPLLEQGADTLVLGCTHYPFLKPSIRSFVGPDISILDTGEAVARRTKDLLNTQGGDSDTKIFTTGSLPNLQKLLPVLCPTLVNYSTEFLTIPHHEL